MHNCLEESGAFSNVMPLSVTIKINGQPTPLSCKIIQLGRTIVKVVGEMRNVLIWLSTDERVCQFIDIMVVDIPQAYGLILRRDWSTKLEGFFVTKWSHSWFPYKNGQNHIKVMREQHMKHSVTQLEGKNEPMNF